MPLLYLRASQRLLLRWLLHDSVADTNEIPPHEASDDNRSVVAEGARCLGLVAARAMAAEEAGEMHPSRSAALCAKVVSILTPLLLEEDHAAAFPSRFPLPLLAGNASRSLLQLCSSPKCPPTLLPGARPIDGFAQLNPVEAHEQQQEGELPVLGSPAYVKGQPREEVRLALARLRWLEKRGLLRGEAQMAVLRQCAKIQAWSSYMNDTGALSELR